MLCLRRGNRERQDDTNRLHGNIDDIHHPTDSTLLYDGVRIITRWPIANPRYCFPDHRRVMKKRVLAILNKQERGTETADV